MTTDAEDRPTWPRNGQVIRRAELLRLIEENGGPDGLDLRGAILVGDRPSDNPVDNPIDLSREALAPLAAAYRRANPGSEPPWIAQHGGVRLDRAQMQSAYIRGALLDEAHLSGVHLEDAILSEATLPGAHLVAAHLDRAYVSATDMMSTDLTYAELGGATAFGTYLRDASLAYANLRRVDLYQVLSLQGVRWYGAFLSHTRIKRESLGKAIGDEIDAEKERTAEAYHRAKEAYLLLKNNFNQIGRYEDASWAYVKEQQMEKMAYHWEWRSQGWQVWRGWGSFWRWLRNWAYELATGYGERPWNPVIGGVLAILGFAAGFCATRAVANLWDALIYSLATFATFNLADTGPTGRGADVASSVEALLGIAVLALVVFTLGNKMSRG